MKTIWYELKIEVPASGLDLVCNELGELGCAGITVEDRALDTFVVPDPDVDAPERYNISAYFPTEGDEAGLRAQVTERLEWLGPLVPGLLPLAMHCQPVREQDWAEGWKQHFNAVRIGRRLIVKPTWEDWSPAADEVVVNLDPGMAFGTGTHGTTRLCLEALAERCDESPVPVRVLDVGTGSGILAIAAAALGARRVLGCDIEEESCRVARENVALNGVGDRVEITGAPLESLEGDFDMILANILAEENIRLGDELARRLAPGGTLILSGILGEKEDLVARVFARYALHGPEVTREAEWVCLRYRKPV
ncbi:50S ribosomal protein L11 methyltransferase [Trichloromonas sp.]|uniref:50S ribosomal protein L11 methyltransferase n=1 Tax=Trichloromonas sp. TaxID=3069249 RepID=UPI002A446D31|nr:50S ribosomal protein L11 methyltransferase [Trichloromonas sp.]